MLDTYRRMLVQINAVHLFGDTYDPYEFEHEPLSEAIHKFPLGALLVSRWIMYLEHGITQYLESHVA